MQNCIFYLCSGTPLSSISINCYSLFRDIDFHERFNFHHYEYFSGGSSFPSGTPLSRARNLDSNGYFTHDGHTHADRREYELVHGVDHSGHSHDGDGEGLDHVHLIEVAVALEMALTAACLSAVRISDFSVIIIIIFRLPLSIWKTFANTELFLNVQ